ncbi:MAG: TerB family tellurite resistance protein [SAR324 cluster bacterium]|nr:TerB family tellurite resistance protein [SAR324 cluster bacterium]
MKGMRLDDIMQELGGKKEQQWFAWAIAGMVMADKKMSKPEEAYMRQLFSKYCDAELSATMADTMKNNKKISLDALQLKDRTLAAKVLKYLAVIAAIDKDIPQDEKKYLQQVGEKLGFSAQSVSHALAWRKREMARQVEAERDENDLTIKLRSETPKYI